MVLAYKRSETQTFSWPEIRDGLMSLNHARFEALFAGLDWRRVRAVEARAPLGEALKYIAKYWDGLCLFLSHGRVELDNNSVERTIRSIALGRKNAFFAGHEAGAHNWATIASLIETCTQFNRPAKMTDQHAHRNRQWP